jgi:DNA-binding MarR family transcriptional regulator
MLDDKRLTIAGLFIEAHRGLIRQLRQVHEAHGLDGLEFDALLRLAHSPAQELRMVDLAAQTHSSTSGTTSLVDRLEAAKLVERRASARDRRSLVVRLTSTGREVLERDVTDLLPTIDAAMVKPLGAELAAFTAALERLRDVLAPDARGGTHKAKTGRAAPPGSSTAVPAAPGRTRPSRGGVR